MILLREGYDEHEYESRSWTEFLFDESGGVPGNSEEEIARIFLGSIQKLRAKQGTAVFMGGPNPAGKILAAEQRQLSDGTPYILVRAATVEEIENPGW